MRVLLVLTLTLALVSASLAFFVCPKDFCKTAKCDAELTESSCLSRAEPGRFTFVNHGGFCGCCPTCIKNLHEGEDCWESLIMDRPASSVCSHDLQCDVHTSKCVKKN